MQDEQPDSIQDFRDKHDVGLQCDASGMPYPASSFLAGFQCPRSLPFAGILSS